MKDNILKEKSEDFALRIVRLHNYLCDKNEKVMSKQLLRSGTSIGANIAESVYAASKSDFINKLSIAQKEAGETAYWIDLLFRADFFDETEYNSIHADCAELLRLLATSIKTAKN
ncbi:MAG: four helix bundle protein [Firmicutes bacterium]|nr:four helix bundle protein [Bacillota bacterium]